MAENVSTTISLTKWDLVSTAAMAACLADLVRMGYRGQLSGYRDQSGAVIWALYLVTQDTPSPTTAPIETTMGNVVVLLPDGHLSAMTPEEYAGRYGA